VAKEAGALQGFPMELAGLELATSWVRCHVSEKIAICRSVLMSCECRVYRG
jgi:hypothetical protein